MISWHPFAERFPLLEGDEWKTFLESIKKSKGNRQPVSFRTVNGKKQGLDGRNREKACEELGLKCRYFEEIVDDDEVKEFILDANIHRRHMTAEMRRDIVAELRADGKSTRAIAAAVGVSHSTVQSDLSSVGRNLPTDSKNIEETKIIGTDGKEYPSAKDRAERLKLNHAPPPPKIHERETGDDSEEPGEKPDSVDDFGRSKKPRAQKPPTPRDVLKDRLGNVLPDSCRDAFADPGLGELIEELEGVESMISAESWAVRAGKLTGHYGFILIEQFREHAMEALHRIELATEALKAGIPYAVCPKCKGVSPKANGKTCVGCRGYGHIPEHKLAEASA